ncbi:MAG TPA: HAD-IIB family hydrolase, partial [Actinomycetes bacterium]|nr:HAD-IIB family hydrolase [Actinomycetes bacterium]
MIRLIATDLDGTIVHDDGSVSVRTLDALAAAEQRGIRVVFVTGRPPRWMAPVARATGHHGLAVCANGAYVYDLHEEVVTQTFAMTAASALAAVDRLVPLLPQAAFAIETTDGFAHEPRYEPRWAVHPLLAVGPITSLIDRPVAKLLVRDESLDGDTMLERARPALRDIAEVTHSNVNDCLLEVSALGVSKATTLAWLAEQWGITREEVVAFGDMPNDLDMLRWAGLGYA